MENIKLTEKSMEVFNIVRDLGRVSVEEIANTLGRTPRSVNANINDLCSAKKGLCVREKVEGEGEDAKPVTYVVLTEAGKAFTPAEG